MINTLFIIAWTSANSLILRNAKNGFNIIDYGYSFVKATSSKLMRFEHIGSSSNFLVDICGTNKAVTTAAIIDSDKIAISVIATIAPIFDSTKKKYTISREVKDIHDPTINLTDMQIAILNEELARVTNPYPDIADRILIYKVTFKSNDVKTIYCNKALNPPSINLMSASTDVTNKTKSVTDAKTALDSDSSNKALKSDLKSATEDLETITPTNTVDVSSVSPDFVALISMQLLSTTPFIQYPLGLSEISQNSWLNDICIKMTELGFKKEERDRQNDTYKYSLAVKDETYRIEKTADKKITIKDSKDTILCTIDLSLSKNNQYNSEKFTSITDKENADKELSSYINDIIVSTDVKKSFTTSTQITSPTPAFTKPDNCNNYCYQYTVPKPSPITYEIKKNDNIITVKKLPENTELLNIDLSKTPESDKYNLYPKKPKLEDASQNLLNAINASMSKDIIHKALTDKKFTETSSIDQKNNNNFSYTYGNTPNQYLVEKNGKTITIKGPDGNSILSTITLDNEIIDPKNANGLIEKINSVIASILAKQQIIDNGLEDFSTDAQKGKNDFKYKYTPDKTKSTEKYTAEKTDHLITIKDKDDKTIFTLDLTKPENEKYDINKDPANGKNLIDAIKNVMNFDFFQKIMIPKGFQDKSSDTQKLNANFTDEYIGEGNRKYTVTKTDQSLTVTITESGSTSASPLFSILSGITINDKLSSENLAKQIDKIVGFDIFNRIMTSNDFVNKSTDPQSTKDNFEYKNTPELGQEYIAKKNGATITLADPLTVVKLNITDTSDITMQNAKTIADQMNVTIDSANQSNAIKKLKDAMIEKGFTDASNRSALNSATFNYEGYIVTEDTDGIKITDQNGLVILDIDFTKSENDKFNTNKNSINATNASMLISNAIGVDIIKKAMIAKSFTDETTDAQKTNNDFTYQFLPDASQSTKKYIATKNGTSIIVKNPDGATIFTIALTSTNLDAKDVNGFVKQINTAIGLDLLIKPLTDKQYVNTTTTAQKNINDASYEYMPYPTRVDVKYTFKKIGNIMTIGGPDSSTNILTIDLAQPESGSKYDIAGTPTKSDILKKIIFGTLGFDVFDKAMKLKLFQDQSTAEQKKNYEFQYGQTATISGKTIIVKRVGQNITMTSSTATDLTAKTILNLDLSSAQNAIYKIEGGAINAIQLAKILIFSLDVENNGLENMSSDTDRMNGDYNIKYTSEDGKIYNINYKESDKKIYVKNSSGQDFLTLDTVKDVKYASADGNYLTNIKDALALATFISSNLEKIKTALLNEGFIQEGMNIEANVDFEFNKIITVSTVSTLYSIKYSATNNQITLIKAPSVTLSTIDTNDNTSNANYILSKKDIPEGVDVIKNIINKLRLDLISIIPGHQATFQAFDSGTQQITEYKYIIYKPNDFSAIITKTQNADWNNSARGTDGSNPSKDKFEQSFQSNGFVIVPGTVPTSESKTTEIHYIWRFAKKNAFIMNRYSYACDSSSPYKEYMANNLSGTSISSLEQMPSVSNWNLLEVIRPIFLGVKERPGFLYIQNNANWDLFLFIPKFDENFDVSTEPNKNLIRAKWVEFYRAYKLGWYQGSTPLVSVLMAVATIKTNFELFTFCPADLAAPMLATPWAFQQMTATTRCKTTMPKPKIDIIYNKINDSSGCKVSCDTGNGSESSCPLIPGCFQLAYAEEAQKQGYLLLIVSNA